MLKLGRVTKVKVLFLLVVFVFHFDLFKFSAAILEKGLLTSPVIKFDNLAQNNLLANQTPSLSSRVTLS